jgi:hypothetical protein
MLPEELPQPTPLPVDRGTSVSHWLASHGLVATQPNIRSSDFGLIRQCPFLYYLIRRLSLVPAISTSPALSQGTWFHKRASLTGSPPETVTMRMHKLLSESNHSIQLFAKSVGLSRTQADELLAEEANNFHLGWALFEASSTLEISPRIGTLTNFLSAPHIKILGHELKLALLESQQKGLVARRPLVAEVDILLFDSRTEQLWVLDFKTTSHYTTTRLQTCPIEDQTVHYSHIVRSLLPIIIETYSLPSTTKFGGMCHVAIQKPKLFLSGLDRDYTEEPHTLKSGPRKGQIEIRRTYRGEPLFSNYLRRCTRWLKGESEYLDLKPERNTHPPINISWTPSSMTDQSSPIWKEYRTKLAFVSSYATIDPVPERFPRCVEGMTDSHGKLSVYAHFYLTDPKYWPSIVEDQNLLIRPRD